MLNDRLTALYLADQDKPLSLCGNTLIKGTCYLPKAGVKRAYIEGQSFSGDKLIDGPVKESQREIPEINKELIKSITSFAQKAVSDIPASTGEEAGQDSIINSFENNTICIVSTGPLRIDRKVYHGNIALISRKSIKISAGADLKDIILFAPRIEIEENFSGNLQAFATDTLIVGKKCKLAYPSVMGLISKNKTGSPMLLVGEETEIAGAVFAIQEEKKDIPVLVKVILEKNAKLTGQLYTDGVLDLKGIVYGTVLCSRFILSTPSSVYENHLLNAIIDNSKLSPYYAGIQLTKNVSVKKIVKWLY